MTEQQIKEYLQKYNITSKELLSTHIEELKRNTIPNLRLISELVFISEDSFYNFLFGEKNYKKGINNHIANATNTPFFLDEVIQASEIVNRNTNSTRHKSQYSETHKEIFGDLEGINKPKEITLKELKENTINNTSLGLDMVEIIGITLCDNKEYIYKLLKHKIAEKTEKEEDLVFPKDSEIHKDDVITNTSSEEKETIGELNKGFLCEDGTTVIFDKDFNMVGELPLGSFGKRGQKRDYSVGVKETNGKIDYSEINLEILDLMAERFTANKHKYPQGNMKKPIDIKSLEWALFRHVKKMIQPIENDEETYLNHLAAILCNASMLYDQIKLKTIYSEKITNCL